MAAAASAAERGLRVGIVDDNEKVGGQIWRQGLASSPEPEASDWSKRVMSAGVIFIRGRVFHQAAPDVLLAEDGDSAFKLEYDKLIVATGARERFLPFRGWTIPNVMGAGGLQAMVKSGLPIEGKRVAVAGTGPLLLAVAAYLHKHGAKIPIVCEQASWKHLLQFGIGLMNQPGKIKQALQLKGELAGVPFSPNSWPIAATGTTALESVTISRGGRTETIACDYLACGFHLVPNIELPLLLGCRIHGGYVCVDNLQRTTINNVFCAGEPTGIGGVELALVEGQIAGLGASGRNFEAQKLFRQRESLRRFASRLNRAFSLRPELRNLASPDTIVCRCEDVRYSRLKRYASWRSAKLETRCGMGACQGRICGPATQFLLKWEPESVRPPIFPARVESLTCARTAAAAK